MNKQNKIENPLKQKFTLNICKNRKKQQHKSYKANKFTKKNCFG